MKRMSKTDAQEIKKAMLKGGIASAMPGLAALTAAFTVPVPILTAYTGMSSMGVAALGILFFFAAFLFYRGYRWASIPSFFFIGWAMWVFGTKAVRLLILYFNHNPVTTIGDIIAQLPVISLQLILVFIAFTLSMAIFNALKQSSRMSPRPVHKLVWGAVGMWGILVALDCMNKFQP